jgi:hypothetical protein
VQSSVQPSVQLLQLKMDIDDLDDLENLFGMHIQTSEILHCLVKEDFIKAINDDENFETKYKYIVLHTYEHCFTNDFIKNKLKNIIGLENYGCGYGLNLTDFVNLKYLKFKASFIESENAHLDKIILPDTLIYLDFTSDYNLILKENNIFLDRLPPNLETLIIRNINNISINNLPRTLKTLILNNCFAYSLDYLPDSLNYLEVIRNKAATDNPAYFDNLPPNLETLIIHLYNHPLNNLPINLKKLSITYYGHINGKYAGAIDNLPVGLKELCLYFSHKITHIKIPPKLEILDIRKYSNIKYDISQLPDTIHTLYMSKEHFEYISGQGIMIPKTIKNLYLPIDTSINFANIPQELDILCLQNEIYFDVDVEQIDYIETTLGNININVGKTKIKYEVIEKIDDL